MDFDDWPGDQPEFHEYSGENRDSGEEEEIPADAITAPDTDGGVSEEQPLIFEPLDNTTLHDMEPAERATVAASVDTFLDLHGRSYREESEEVKEVGIERVAETRVETGRTCNIPVKALQEVGSKYDKVQLNTLDAHDEEPRVVGIIAGRMVEATVDTYDPVSGEPNGRQPAPGLELKLVKFMPADNGEVDVVSDAVLTAPFPPRAYIVPLVDETSGEAMIGVARESPQQDGSTPTLNVSELHTIMRAVERVSADPEAYAGKIPIMEDAKITLDGQELVAPEGVEAQTGLAGLSEDEQTELFTALERTADNGESYQDRIPVWNESGFSEVSIIVGNYAHAEVADIEQAGLSGYTQAEVESSDTISGDQSRHELKASIAAAETVTLEIPTRDGLPMRTEETAQVLKQVLFVTENNGTDNEIKYVNVRSGIYIPYVGDGLVNFATEGRELSAAEAQGLLRLARILQDKRRQGEAS